MVYTCMIATQPLMVNALFTVTLYLFSTFTIGGQYHLTQTYDVFSGSSCDGSSRCGCICVFPATDVKLNKEPLPNCEPEFGPDSETKSQPVLCRFPWGAAAKAAHEQGLLTPQADPAEDLSVR